MDRIIVIATIALALALLAGICSASAMLYVAGYETASLLTYVPGAFVAAIPLMVLDRRGF